MKKPDYEVWKQLLTQLDDPSVGTIAEELSDTRDIDIGTAYDVTKEAIRDGILIEVETGGAFSSVRLDEAKTAGKTETADMEIRGAASSADDPRDDIGKTGLGPTVDDPHATLSGDWCHPTTITERDWWVTWILDEVGRKRPVAPWQNGHAYPAKWADDLPDEERPETDYDTARRWVEFDLSDTGLELPESAQSDDLGLGIILPADRPEDLSDRITLIDWDDVRDPDTEEIHPVAAEYIDRFGGYVEVSTSGEGLHQFVTGGLRHRGKFIAPIDEEPFIGDDLPQVEVYDGGRHVAMTGRHVAGTDRDAVEGQELIDELVTEYADAERGAGHRRFDPETGDDGGPTGEAGGSVPKPEAAEYDGPALADLRGTKPTDRSLAYHAAVEAFYRGAGNADGYASVQNWRLEGFVAALGERDDLDREEIKKDLRGEYLDETDVPQRCTHRTPERIDYGYERAASGRLAAPSYETLVAYGVLPEEILDDGGDSGEEWRDDPREVGATVDPRRAWDAAGRVTPDDFDDNRLRGTDPGEMFACPECGSAVDVVRAVAVAEGLVDTCDAALDAQYPEAYTLAREEYGAPLPEYYTTTDAIAEFDAVLDVIGELSFFHLDTDALATEVTATDDDVDGEAVRALNPAWRESESEESVLVFDSGTIWDADTRRVVDVLRFVALDNGLLDDPREALEGSDFTDAYGLARTEYGAPLPRWEPAEDGAREITPQLPPSDELVDARDVEGVDPDALEDAREDVEALIADATANDDTPTVVTALPATGKTTGTVKTAQTRALSYLAPRKELQAQALDKADRWGVDAEVLPVFSEERVRDEVLASAVSHVREEGKARLRDRWAVLFAAFDGLDEEEAEELDVGDIFDEDEEDTDDVDLDRPTCETAEGDHGVDWALAVHVARRLGYTPREIHQQARGLFGAPLPCTAGEDGHDGANCEYGAGWDRVTDADATPDLLVGSYVHAHVESVRTEYTPGAREGVDKAPRAVVLDEVPGEAFVREFGDEAEDFATWLARCLRDDVEDRRDMLEADLGADQFVTSWLEGREGDDVATAGLARVGDHLDARNDAAEILDEVERGALEAIDLAEPLEAVVDADTEAAAAFDALDDAIDAVDPEEPASGLANWADDAVRTPLARATLSGSYEPSADAVDTGKLGIGADLEGLVEEAVEAARERRDGAAEAVDAAVTALRGGREGCRRLAAWATDGYAHPDAHHLLGAVVEVDPTRIQTSSWAFDPDATDGTVLDVVDTGERARTVLDRNGHGARIHTPPSRTSGSGDDAPLVGLDATGRAELWSNALGEEVVTADIHDTPEERAAFLEDALDLRVLQAANRPRPYEGDPTTKDTDGDVALLEAIAEEYSGVQAPRERGGKPVEIGKPAAITTKGVRGVLENDTRLNDVVTEWENYGNLTGDNQLGGHRLAAILGSQHYGDHAIERFCALAGEEVDTDRVGGRGTELDYGSDLANTYLKHMREDQTTQAILRFTRGNSGATVIARTSALREDLPVVGNAQIVETWSDTATQVARAYRRLSGAFTIADVADAVGVSRRQVRRVLAELADAGYLERVSAGTGVATEYRPADMPGAGEVKLPARGGAVGSEPGHSAHNQYYTWNVRVFGDDWPLDTAPVVPVPLDRGAPPAPTAVEGDPPG